MKGHAGRGLKVTHTESHIPTAATLSEYAAAIEWAVHLERQRILEAVLALPGVKLVERDAVVRVIT